MKTLYYGKHYAFSIDRMRGMTSISSPMNTVQADRVVKAIVDGVEAYTEIEARADVEPTELAERAAVLNRAIRLMRGFYKYADENMKPAGLPPPGNPYFNPEKGVDAQLPEYYAFEALQRNGMDRARCIWTCGQLGLEAAAAETAIDNVSMPWREANGWKTYVREEAGKYILMNQPPVKLKRHLERILDQLAG